MLWYLVHTSKMKEIDIPVNYIVLTDRFRMHRGNPETKLCWYWVSNIPKIKPNMAHSLNDS